MNFSRHSVLIIGCGSIGTRHLPCLQLTGRASVTAGDANASLLAGVADSHFIARANAFLHHIGGKPARVSSVEAAAQTLRFNLASFASAASGIRVDCKDIHA
jgi:hypothetical protein